MPDEANITENLLELYGRNDGIMRANFHKFINASGLGELPRRAKILDCGCGMGHLIIELKSLGFNDVTGIDSAAEMVEAAGKLSGAAIVRADAADVGKTFPPETFDAVIVSDLAHHIPSLDGWRALYSGCRAVLKPGGLLAMREPYPMITIRLLYFLSRFSFLQIGFMKGRLRSFVEEDELLRFFFANWPENYRRILQESGFEISVDKNLLVQRITVCHACGRDERADKIY